MQINNADFLAISCNIISGSTLIDLDSQYIINPYLSDTYWEKSFGENFSLFIFCFHSLTFTAKNFVLDVWLDPEYVSRYSNPKDCDYDIAFLHSGYKYNHKTTVSNGPKGRSIRKTYFLKLCDGTVLKLLLPGPSLWFFG